MKETVMQGKPYAGNPHVRFDEGAGAPRHSGRSALLYKTMVMFIAVTAIAVTAEAMLDLQPQIDAVAAKGGGVVRVEPGEHETKPFELKSNVTLELANGATILASTNIADYATRGECPVFIYADHATNVAIVGKGTINGRGGGFRETAKLRGEDQPKTLPLLMRFSRCRNVRLEGFHYTNPGSWACHLRNCDGVTVKGTSCFNYCNKMTDGLDIESCNVTVEDCDFYADDDSLTRSSSARAATAISATSPSRTASCAAPLAHGVGIGEGRCGRPPSAQHHLAQRHAHGPRRRHGGGGQGVRAGEGPRVPGGVHVQPDGASRIRLLCAPCG